MSAPKKRAKVLLLLLLAASLCFGAPAAFAAQWADGTSLEAADAAEIPAAQSAGEAFENASDEVGLQEASDASTDSGISLMASSTTIAESQGLSSLAGNAANAWQVVSEGYEGNGTSNKTASSDDNVAVQKNVVPTGIENEFLVYLSIDYKAALKNYFETAEYQATPSNNNHGHNVGDLVSSMTGNQKVSVAGGNTYSRSGKFTIVDPDGNAVASNVTISWSQGNNVTFYLKIDDSHYVLFGTSVRDGGSNNVALSAEAWNLIRQEAVKTALNKVTDTMGDNIEYVETVNSDGDTSYDSTSKTLTWTPSVKTNCETESSTSGSETITWYRNAAELVYKVRLTPPRSTGLTSSDGTASPASAADAVCSVNSKATLTYDNTSTVDFPVPKVKGLLYDLVFTKVAKGTNAALPGAMFKLQQNDSGTWRDVTDSGGNLITATSDASGMVAFTGLQYGTYRAVETQAPRGYKSIDENGDPLTWGPSTPLCWTTNSINLMPSRAESANVMAAESDGATVADPRSLRFMVLKEDANGDPLPGVTFTLTPAGDTATSADSESVTVTKDGANASENAAAAIFGNLDNGTYTLTESRVVAGYVISSSLPYTLTVGSGGISVTNSAGHAVDLNTLTYGGETYYYLTVTNESLPSLPEAGGMGGLCVYAAGTAALLLGLRHITRRRGRHAAKG